jgi:hypothetical protein
VAAIAANASPVAGQPITFDASGSTHDPAGSIVNYRWDLDGSGRFATDTATNPTATTTYSTPRTLPVSVRITDDAGQTSTATDNLVVGSAPPVPRFSFAGPLLVGQPVTFDAGTSTDIDSTIVDYRWDLDGSSNYLTDTGATPRATTVFSSPGTVAIGLRVTDALGATARTTRTVQVTRPPVARLSASPATPAPGQPVLLDAGSSSDPDGLITAYAWDLDGSGRFTTTTGSTPFLTHAFSAGAHPIGVRVTDNFGASQTASIILKVGAPGSPGTPGSTDLGASPSPAVLSGLGLGGDTAHGIAVLSRSDLTAIVAGSPRHFAAISGSALRRARTVAARGLWINLLADRPVLFDLHIAISASDARRLRLRGARRRGLVSLAAGRPRLVSAGQRPAVMSLPARTRRALRRLHRGRVVLLVSGVASDRSGHRATVSRAFALRP